MNTLCYVATSVRTSSDAIYPNEFLQQYHTYLFGVSLYQAKQNALMCVKLYSIVHIANI